MRLRTDLPSANVCAVEFAVDGDCQVVRFAADPHGGTETLWFAFGLDGCGGRPLELVLANADSCLGFGAAGQSVRPVVRQADGDWERVASTTIRALADGRHEAVWQVTPTGDSLDFAFCYPYTPADLQTTLRDTGGWWRQDAIGVTQHGRPLPRLSNTGGAPDSQTPGVYLLARQHSGETPGSWVLDGLLRAAPAQATGGLVIWAVPFANLDGVVEGDYGKDPFPHDLNRAWTRPAMRHEVLVMQRDMARWASRCRPVLVLDLHAPGAADADGAFFFLPRPARPPVQVAAARKVVEALRQELPATLMRATPDCQPTYAGRWTDDGMVGVFVADTFGVPGICLETPYSLSRDVLLTRERYLELGAALLRGILRLAGQ